MENNDTTSGLQKGLEKRHIILMSLACAIGVGLFLGSSSAIELAGPSVILAYIIGGVFMYFIMRALGEMSVEDPSPGAFSYYAGKYLGKGAGFTVGWNYSMSAIIFCMSEITAVAIYMKFWFPDVPQWIWACGTFVLMIGINLLDVKVFGEFEYWFAMIKVCTIIIMIVLGVSAIFFGLGNGGVAIGLQNLWAHGGFFPHGFAGMAGSLFLAMWSYGGMEMIAMTAAEVKDPSKTLKSAINNTFWRILLFYVGSMFVILCVYPWTQISTNGSPFVNIFTKFGIAGAAGIVNFVVITAALSSFNSNTYGSVRILYNLAQKGHAPAAFAKTNKHGVPQNAVLAFAAIVFISVVGNYVVPEQIFMYFASIGTLCSFFTWIMILVSQIKFHKSLSKEQLSNLEYRMPLAPYTSYATLVFLFYVVYLLYNTSWARVGVIVGVIWLTILVATYFVLKKRNKLVEVDEITVNS
jgi:AAT family amino acid transporter